MFSEEQIAQAKAKYGPLSVLTVEGVDYIMRSLTPMELTALGELRNSLPEKDWMQAVISMAVLYPKVSEFKLAGSPFRLQNTIMENSIPISDNGDFKAEDYREWAEDITKTNAAVLLAVKVANAYPSANLIDLLNMPMEKLMRTAALVEKITDQNIFGTGKHTTGSNDPAEALRAEIEKGRKNTNGR